MIVLLSPFLSSTSTVTGMISALKWPCLVARAALWTQTKQTLLSIHLYDIKYAAITVLEYDENFILLYNNSLESDALYLTY